MKRIILILALIFTCSWVDAQTYLQENFDAEIPATWTITDEGGAMGDSWISGQQGGANSLNGSNCAIVDSDSNGNGTLLIETLTSPVFDTTGAVALFLDFDQFYNNIGADTAIVEVFDGTNWNEVLNQTADAGGFNAPDQQHIDITAYSNANMQVRFIYNDNDVWAWYWLVDDVEVYNSTCNFPSGLTANNITANTVDISWTAGGAEAAWEIAVQPAGSGEPAGSGTAITDNPYTVNALTAITNYEVYIRANCGADGFSNWAGPLNFQTACDVFVPEYVESFTVITPDCWDEAGNGDATTGPMDLGAGDWNPDGFLNDGFEGAYKINLWQAFKSDWILSPQFDLTGGPFQVDFDFGIMQFASETTAGTLGSDDTVELLISTDNGATWTNLLTWDNTSVVPVTGTQVVVDLAAYSGQTVQFGILGSEGTVDDIEDNDVFVDNFRVRLVPTCQEPTDLNVANVGGTTADISWTAGGAETSWEYVVQPPGTGLPTGSGTTVVTTSVSETGLDYDTGYEIWVRADCGGTDGFSSWTGPVVITTTIQTDFIVDCSAGQITDSICYPDGDSLIITYTSSDGTPLNLTFNSGEVEGAPFDFLVVYDSDGSELYNDEGNNGDISGLTFQSTGDTISFQVTSDVSVSCEGGTFPEGINYTVACATCINPAATYQVIDDCANGEQFLVDVNVTTIGDAMSLTISNNIDANTVPATAAGIYQVGPFPFGVDVIITLSNDQDGNCIINSSPIQLLACPPDNDNPCGATIAQVNADATCDLITPGTLLEATDSGVPGGSCAGDPDDDVWFEFTALNEIQIIQLSNINSSGFPNLDHAVYEGTCDAPVELYCSEANASLTPALTVGNTYFVRVFSSGNNSVDTTFDLCIRPGTGNVAVDQTTYSIEELVVDILIANECAEISNIEFSTGTNFGDVNGIGYFSTDDPDSFPFEEGLLLTSGDASLAAGPNFNAMSDGGGAWPGDAELNAAVGITSNNASIIEFDFVPLADEISFDFLMASEEYNGSTGGTFECTFSDAFAFLLTDSNGVTTNLAVLPGTNTPILVTNIHPENPGCPAINEEYFGGYTPENLPPMSFDGRTEVFTAFSEVNLGETYHIKLVIADATDTQLDSGVFLKAGSFDIGEIDLGADITIDSGTATCLGEDVILQTDATTVPHVWYLDGIAIAGETSNVLVVNEPGVYTVQIIFSPLCDILDEIIVEFLPLPEMNLTPDDIVVCSATNEAIFNLNDNDDVVLANLDPSDYSVSYHISQDEATLGINPLASPYMNVSNPQEIFVRVDDNITQCYDTASFNLVISAPDFVVESVNITGCDNDGDGVSEFDLDANTANVLGSLDASQFIVTYHLAEADAIAGTGDLVSPYESSGETVYVRVESIDYIDCYVVGSFDLVFGLEPQTSFTNDFDYEVCPGASVPIIIEATPENYNLSEVSIRWFRDDQADPIAGQTGLTLPVLEGTVYSIEVTFNDTGCQSLEDIEVVTLESCFIPQGISPNNDGKNDEFDLSNFRVTRLEIFNRYGSSVYEKTNYVDEWFGQSNDGKELPVGTYFYSIEFEDRDRETGWVYIQREN